MEWDWIWKSFLIVISGTLLLRLAGRKSIAQMTLAQTVVMIGIGSLLIQPLAGKNVWITIGVGALLMLTLILMEYGQLKSDRLEQFITGKSKVVIENGMLQTKNLRKLRLTVDQLEIQLRQNQISRIDDVQFATLEPNGQLGIQLKEHVQPATKRDLQILMLEVQELRELINTRMPYVKWIRQLHDKEEEHTPSAETEKYSSPEDNSNQDTIFQEVSKKAHQEAPPKYLQ